MKLPESANEPVKAENIKNSIEEVIQNPYFNVKVLTVEEAVDCINHLSGALLIHGYSGQSKQKYRRCFQA